MTKRIYEKHQKRGFSETRGRRTKARLVQGVDSMTKWPGAYFTEAERKSVALRLRAICVRSVSGRTGRDSLAWAVIALWCVFVF